MFFFDKAKKFGKKIIIADGVDNTVSPKKTEETNTAETHQEEISETPAPMQKKSDNTNNGIDLRSDIVDEIIKICRPAMGRNDDKFANLKIWLVGNQGQAMLEYAWADNVFVKKLERLLDDNMMAAVGSNEISFDYAPQDQIPSDAIPVREGVYIQFPQPVIEGHSGPEAPAIEDNDVDEAVDGRTATLELLSPKGACEPEKYKFDTAKKSYLNIGQGPEAVLLPNDIAIYHKVAPTISHNHAQIVYQNKHFYIKDFSKNGTQIIHNGTITNVPSGSTNVRCQLKNNDVIVLAGVVKFSFVIDAQ